jgi:hypothetical protein
MPSWSYEHREEIYRRLQDRRKADPGKQTIEEVDLTTIIADWIVLQFPDLLLLDNKWVFLRAVEMKFDEILQWVIDDQHLAEYILDEEQRLSEIAELVELGVIKPVARQVESWPF